MEWHGMDAGVARVDLVVDGSLMDRLIDCQNAACLDRWTYKQPRGLLLTLS